MVIAMVHVPVILEARAVHVMELVLAIAATSAQ